MYRVYRVYRVYRTECTEPSVPKFWSRENIGAREKKRKGKRIEKERTLAGKPPSPSPILENAHRFRRGFIYWQFVSGAIFRRVTQKHHLIYKWFITKLKYFLKGPYLSSFYLKPNFVLRRITILVEFIIAFALQDSGLVQNELAFLIFILIVP